MAHDTEVLVVGAGPAGACAARACAAAGINVMMVDRARFQRDKVCGDALIPDALAVLRRVGLDSTVAPYARSIGELRIFPQLGYVVVSLSNLDPPAASELVEFFTLRMPDQ